MSATDSKLRVGPDLVARASAPPSDATKPGLLAFVDPVVAAIALILIVLFLLAPENGPRVLSSVLRSTISNLPFMLAAVLISAATKAAGFETIVAAAAGAREGRMVLAFAVLGALMPFCSCGVIPIIASLLAAGVPLAPVMAFWMSAPLMDPNQFLILSAQLGWPFAVAKLAAAIGLGMMSGYLTMAVVRAGAFADPLRFTVRITGRNKYDPTFASEPKWKFWQDRERLRVFRSHSTHTFWFLFRWLVLAFVLEAIMLAYTPPSLFKEWFGSGEAWAIPMAAAVGSVIYINTYAAIPLIAGLIQLGMSPAAGFTFLLAGGLTTIPASMAVWVLVKPRVFLWHLLLAVAGSLIAGYCFVAFTLLR